MSALKKIQDGGGDSLPKDKPGDNIKPDETAQSPGQILDPYEGLHHEPTETGKVPVAAGKEEQAHTLPQNEENKDVKTEHQKPRQTDKATKSVPHRRHEDHRNMLHFDYSFQADHTKKSLPPGGHSATVTERFSDEEMESSPLIEDRGKEVRLQRQREYRQQLTEQIAQREEKRQQQKAKKNRRVTHRLQGAADLAATRDSRLAVDHYENQLRMEQLMDMRKQIQVQREREVERLRRIYRKDDKKLLAHLQRLKLLDNDTSAYGEGDVTTQRGVAYPSQTQLPTKLPSTQATASKTSESKPETVQSKQDNILPSVEVPYTDAAEAAASSNAILSRKKSEKGEEKDILNNPQAQSSLTSATRALGKTPTKPFTYKQAYLRLQQRRREEEMMLEERRAKAVAWRAELARQERLERDVRNMAEWRAGHSLAGVPLKPILPAQRRRFEAAASWLEKQRAEQQEKRLEKDRQLMNWREEKNKQSYERRLKEKAELKVAKEIQAERRKEAEKCFERWLQEIRARKAFERASVPRGAIGVSTYSSAYTLPAPWRQPPKQTWRRRSFMSTSLSEIGKDDVTL